MKNLLHILLSEPDNNKGLVVVTILATKGSTPQVAGSSSAFINGKLKAGTLGGGILEADATHRSAQSTGKDLSLKYEFSLNSGLNADSGAICGGSAILLLDGMPGRNRDAFKMLKNSIDNGKQGILATLISGDESVKIERYWFENGKPIGKAIPTDLSGLENDMSESLQKRNCKYLEKNDTLSVFLQPVYPLPKLVIVGAGHIGKALSHFTKLLDFEVTVIDGRPEYANQQNLPDADHIIAGNIGEAVSKIPVTADTYIVIVSQGHRDDTEALKACIKSEAPYIGMIGSKRKVRLMRENFIRQGWATVEEFDRIHAPVGLEINSKTIQEIAVSICAELVQVRNQVKFPGKSKEVSAIILAAGASKRMGTPKMLLSFGDKSIIEKVVSQAILSGFGKIIVVLGSGYEAIQRLLHELPVETALNSHYEDGMLSSIQCGLRAASPGSDGAMILLGDQPMISNSVIDKVLECFKGSGKNIIVACHNQKRGHPILIGKKHFQEILDYPAKKTLRELLIKYPDDIEEVETGSPEILRDIDTQQEYWFDLKNKNKYD